MLQVFFHHHLLTEGYYRSDVNCFFFLFFLEREMSEIRITFAVHVWLKDMVLTLSIAA